MPVLAESCAVVLAFDRPGTASLVSARVVFFRSLARVGFGLTSRPIPVEGIYGSFLRKTKEGKVTFR